MSATFSNGSAHGTNICTNVTVNSDSEVESEEQFTVMLALVVSGTSLSLGNTTSAVILIDNDGNFFLRDFGELNSSWY